MVAKIRNYTDMEFHGRLNFAQELTDFPQDAAKNDLVIINGVLWLYSMVGGLLTWFPLNNQKDSYIHTQGLAASTWTVNHNLGSQDFVLGVYDSSNNLMIPSSITNVTDDNFQLTFTEPVIGRAVAIFSTHLFAPSVTTQSVVADSINVGGGAVTADDTGLYVSGSPVPVLNEDGFIDGGTL